MKTTFAIVALIVMLSAWAWSQAESGTTQRGRAQSSYMFQIPAYPETELFQSRPVLADLNPPFAITLEIYTAKTGKPLNKDSVLAFYRDALTAKGWKEGIFNGQPSEPYLSMRTNLSEDLRDGSRTQVAGEFYVWVAPHDGMITVYTKQWRVSSTDQATLDSLDLMTKQLTVAALKEGYRIQRVASDSGWKRDFENEYLVSRARYALIPNGNHAPMMDAPPGTLSVVLLTYRDGNVAMAESNLRKQEYKSGVEAFSAGVRGKVLITINGDASQEKLNSLVAAALSH